MKFNQSALQLSLKRLADGTRAKRYVLAFSGGLDSTCLLHALSCLPEDTPILAMHVDHGLHAASADWTRHCADVCADLGVPYESCEVSVDPRSGLGPEAAAREARYEALRAALHQGDWLLTAHHLDDQAETLLLNLLRGSGVSGLAGIPNKTALGDAWLVRPLLSFPRAALEAYAQQHALRWVDDPSNDENDPDRNFLRNKVLPLVESRWPAARRRLAHSAGLTRDAASLLADLGDADFRELRHGDSLPIAGLLRLSLPRQKNLLRRAVHALGLPPLPGSAS